MLFRNLQTEKALKIFAVVIVIQLLLLSTIILSVHFREWEPGYISTPMTLTARNHDISRVEDLFIPFEYEHNMSCTFVMTENFTELTIVMQPDTRKTNGTYPTYYYHELEINGSAKIVGYRHSHPIVKQYHFDIVGLRYNATYTLTFKKGNGVAVAI